MSIELQVSHKRCCLFSCLPGVAKYRVGEIHLQHSHRFSGPVRDLNQRQKLDLIHRAEVDIVIFQDAVYRVEKLLENGTINKTTSNQYIRLLTTEINKDTSLIELVKLALQFESKST